MRKPVQYDTLVRIRQLQEDLQAQILAATRYQAMQAEERRNQLQAERRRLLEEAADKAKHSFDAQVIGAYYRYERHLSHLADLEDAELARLHAVAESQRVELEQAMKHRRMVEKLKEQLVAAYETRAKASSPRRASGKACRTCSC